MACLPLEIGVNAKTEHIIFSFILSKPLITANGNNKEVTYSDFSDYSCIVI